MSSRADEIRKKMAKKKREMQRSPNRGHKPLMWNEEEQETSYGYSTIPDYDHPPLKDDGHPLFKKEAIIFKILFSACLFLAVAIMFRSEAPSLSTVKTFITSTMEKDFQFAAVADWYEDQFGKPLALLPVKDDEKDEESDQNLNNYALPASAKIVEDFDDNGQRMILETEKGASVEAMSEGYVSFAGLKEDFGNTVVIQHPDRSESWYGNLESIDVKLSQYINKGTSVGAASASETGEKGSFYLAIKKGDNFIDPIQVIPFD
ncbi:M23 family metallopeptidase [Cytobacillus gottheilii]|uniref:M23 family metallopeptidase n=1 Tax=Cytobacillus gottheilii TaxID=859144 RepID=UPI0009B9F7F3|nr:M23 family metallopeptidase [Cytobacillus gottheilii]